MIKEFAKYIEQEVESLTVDTNLFAGFRPAEAPERCVAVLEPTGGSPDSYLPDAGEKMVQVLSRAPSYWHAREDIYEVFNALISKINVELPEVEEGVTYKALFIEAVNFPQSLAQDDNALWEFSANFIVRIRKQVNEGE